MPNYNNGKIYKLVNSVDDEVYIGSTTQSLAVRKGGHKRLSVSRSTCRVYEHLNRIGWDNVRIILIENVFAFNKEQLVAREQHYIDLLKPSLNTRNAVYSDCPHGREQSRCTKCEGDSVCVHKKRKYECVECGGSQICSHGRRKQNCKACGGVSICSHGKRKYECKNCGGVSICSHGKRKYECKTCGGSQICSHNKRKHMCKTCNKGIHRCHECDIILSSNWSLSKHNATQKHIKKYNKLLKEVFG